MIHESEDVCVEMFDKFAASASVSGIRIINFYNPPVVFSSRVALSFTYLRNENTPLLAK